MTKTETRKSSMKFDERYGAKEYKGVYKIDPALVRIPGPKHFLYDQTAPTTFDPARVEQVDKDGHLTDAIEVYTDPENRVLWTVDGRGRILDALEVNRRRKADGREPILVRVYPTQSKNADAEVNEKELVARVRLRNYHRRTPSRSDMAIDIAALRAQGWSWDDCATTLHHETEDAAQWARKILPLAFCIKSVREAFDAEKIPLSKAVLFSGKKVDGEEAGNERLSDKEQAKLLAQMLEERSEKASKGKAKSVRPSPKHVASVAAALTAKIAEVGKVKQMALAPAAALAAWISGDASALDGHPDIAEICAACKPKMGRKTSVTADATEDVVEDHEPSEVEVEVEVEVDEDEVA